MAASKPHFDLSQVNDILQTLLEFVKTLGWIKGVFAIFFFLMQGAVFFLYRGRLVDRQNEINRLAIENREYRTFFMEKLKIHYEEKKETPAKGKGGK